MIINITLIIITIIFSHQITHNFAMVMTEHNSMLNNNKNNNN
jgi:hypothetical protein